MCECYNELVTAHRYSRQMLFRGIGDTGQEKISRAKVCLVGCGALGTVSAEMLVRAGVGRIQIVDRDFVEQSNLQRQSLFVELDARDRQPKALAAQKALRAINSEVEIRAAVADLTWANVQDFLSQADVVIDGTDNFETRLLINDFCVKYSVPWVYGGCVAGYGLSFAIVPRQTPCLQCFLHELPGAGAGETCETAGILAPVVHVVASRQVTQVLRILVGQGPSMKLLHVDVWEDQWRTVSVRGGADPNCPCCGHGQYKYLEGKIGDRLVLLCGRDAVQVTPGESGPVDFAKLGESLSRVGRVSFNEYLMKIEVDGFDITLFPDGRAIIRGTDDLPLARSVYARYLGR